MYHVETLNMTICEHAGQSAVYLRKGENQHKEGNTMATARGNQLAQEIMQKVAALKQICQEVDENTSSRAPAGRWSPKQILSHLCGPEGVGHLPILRAFVDSDTPMIDLDTENPFFTENRARMTFGELVAEFEMNYQRIADFAEELTEEQLARKAHIPKLIDSPLGEYPTLAGMIAGLGEYHVQFHIDHLREILAALSSK
jgi:hypothetical protein